MTDVPQRAPRPRLLQQILSRSVRVVAHTCLPSKPATMSCLCADLKTLSNPNFQLMYSLSYHERFCWHPLLESSNSQPLTPLYCLDSQAGADLCSYASAPAASRPRTAAPGAPPQDPSLSTVPSVSWWLGLI